MMLRQSHGNANGFSLVTVLIFVAVVSLVSIAISVLLGTVEGYIQRMRLAMDAETAGHYAQAIMSDRKTCAGAVRNGGQILTYNGGSSDVEFDTLMLNNQPALSKGKAVSLNSAVTISHMYLSPVSPGAAPGVNGELQIAGGTYYAYAFNLIIQFDGPTSMLGGTIKPQTIPVTLAAKTASPYTMDQCPGTLSSLTSQSCSALVGENTDCTGSPPAGQCSKFYYIQGFDSSGAPTCVCQWLCT